LKLIFGNLTGTAGRLVHRPSKEGMR
jgi:hypothetical protein